jgi:hypothetical protein
MKKQPIVVLLVLLFVSVLAGDGFAQKWSFGPILGEAIKPTSTTISAQMDSICVFESSYASAQAAGVFVNYRVRSLLEVHAALSFYTNQSGILVQNCLAQGWEGLVKKGGSVTHHTLELPIFLRLQIPLGIRHFEFGVQGGLNTHFYISEPSEIELPGKPEHAKVINALSGAAKPVKMMPTYGVYAILFNRVEINAKYTKVNNYVNDVTYNGDQYSIFSQAEYLFITLGYRFYSFRSKKKQEE